MRKLTIKRSGLGIYGNFGAVKIFVEDNSGKPDLVIKGVPCRFLGLVRGGETETFEISEDKTKVFAIMSEMYRNHKYDYRIIEAGSEDVVLGGKSTYSKLLGYMFEFDGDAPPEADADYNKWKGIMIGVYIGTIVVSIAIGIVLAKFLK